VAGYGSPTEFYIQKIVEGSRPSPPLSIPRR
jgi:hypothetical protein